MAVQVPIIFVLGAPGAGKGTLSTRLTENFPVGHISVGDLLRRIKNDPTHPEAEAITPAQNRQELIDAKVLVPILTKELESVSEMKVGGEMIRAGGADRRISAKHATTERIRSGGELSMEKQASRSLLK